MRLFGRRNERRDGTRVARKDRTGASPVAVGLAVLAIVLIGTFLGFTKHIPFTHGFEFKAVVPSANSVRKNSPVRIAGVNVGKVKAIERYKHSNMAVITMEVQDQALPIHRDATIKIRPRIFLEGNFFVDLKPGTPQAPTIGENATLPVTQATDPVQFGDVLAALQSDDRRNLQSLLDNYGRALTGKPTAADDAQADPSMRGKTGAQALNDAARHSGPAFRDTAIVNDAFLGTDTHDLSNLIRGLARVTGGLGRNERTLQDFVTNFDTTLRAFADERTSLRSTIRLLGPTLQVADRTLGDLDNALPSTRRLALALIPGTRETPSTIDAAMPWIAQTRALLRPAELRGLAQDLSPATRDLSRTTDAMLQFLPQQDLVAKCLTNVILPTGDIKIADGPLSTNEENYKEFWYTMVGLAGESQNFDGNGQYVRFQPGGGDQTFSTGSSSLSGDTYFGRDPNRPLGTRPAYPGKRPPYRPDVPCYTQPLPDLNGAATGPADGSAAGASARAVGPGSGTFLAQPKMPVRGAKARAARRASVTAALVNRLNPWRTRKGGR